MKRLPLTTFTESLSGCTVCNLSRFGWMTRVGEAVAAVAFDGDGDADAEAAAVDANADAGAEAEAPAPVPAAGGGWGRDATTPCRDVRVARGDREDGSDAEGRVAGDGDARDAGDGEPDAVGD